MSEQHKDAPSLTLFFSYASEDEPLRNELEKHLSLLQRQGIITTWHDRQIVPGTDWAHAVDSHLKEASIILLLISPDFMASDYCYSSEMQFALDRHKQGLAYVIPILLRPVDWQGAPFSHLFPLPLNKRPVTLWESRDAAFLEVVTAVRAAVAQIHGQIVQRTSRSSTHISHQERKNFLKRVRYIWIQGVLEKSLHQAVLIALGLQEQPDALANPWSLIVQETAQAPHPLPSGTHIIQVYEEADGKLLILGEPGSGKTTLLLELARDLLDRAEQDESRPMPAVFNLSSWAEKRQPLIDWLVEELRLKYQVPSQLAKLWLSTNCILPLLDGLDEVNPTHRTACSEAINTYQGEHHLVPLVVCSRSKEYFSQTSRLRLHNAVTVQPLTVQQVDEYLMSAGEQLTALRTVLHDDTVLLKLATNPLMLSVITLTYHGKAIGDLTTTGTLEARRQQIFDAYVKRTFERRGVTTHYTPQQTIDWLKWLASRMMQHYQNEFYLESMQPDWLWENAFVDTTSGRLVAQWHSSCRHSSMLYTAECWLS
jgi:GTPase SAR1 family protein